MEYYHNVTFLDLPDISVGNGQRTSMSLIAKFNLDL